MIPSVDVTPDNWRECIDSINWLNPILVTALGMRIIKGFDGRTFYIPDNVWNIISAEATRRRQRLEMMGARKPNQ